MPNLASAGVPVSQHQQPAPRRSQRLSADLRQPPPGWYDRYRYLDPTRASRPAAMLNYLLLTAAAPRAHVCSSTCFAYALSTSHLAGAYVVQSTADLGDIPIPTGYRQAVNSPWAAYWKEAIAKELKGLMDLKTWDTVRVDELPPDANLMNCHMVFTVKRKSDGTVEKFKCRLVADGNTQRHGVDFDQVFSTVVKISTIRIVLAIAAALDYNCTSTDIRQAYLQATLDQDLYMRMPPGLPSKDVQGRPLCVKLNRSLYGLKQAGREWAHLFASFLVSWGFVQSSADTCLFMYSSDGCILWILVYVDDTVMVDNDASLRERFMESLSARFPVEDKHELEWILGVKVTRDRSARSIKLSQELYIRDLLKRHAGLFQHTARRFDSPMDSDSRLSPEQQPAIDSEEYTRMLPLRDTYMTLVGAFLWLSNVTRPDLTYAASQLARFVSNPAEVHYAAAIRVLLYLEPSVGRVLHYRPTADARLVVYVDSDWGVNLSVSGAFFVFMNCPVAWFARTQRSVSLSSTEAEFFAAMVAARDGIHYRDVLSDLGYVQQGPTLLRSDNKGVCDLSLDPIAFKKTKHIARAANFLRDLCARRVFELKHIAGAINIADILTKGQALAVFVKLMKILHNLSQESTAMLVK